VIARTGTKAAPAAVGSANAALSALTAALAPGVVSTAVASVGAANVSASAFPDPIAPVSDVIPALKVAAGATAFVTAFIRMTPWLVFPGIV
jgi:hypothetical protein